MNRYQIRLTDSTGQLTVYTVEAGNQAAALTKLDKMIGLFVMWKRA